MVEQTKDIGLGSVGPALTVQVIVLAIADRDFTGLPPTTQKEVSFNLTKLFWRRLETG